MPVTSVLVDDQPLLIEIEDRHVPVPPAAQGEFEDVESTIARVTDLGTFIQHACIQLYGSVKKATETIKPSEVKLTFGVKLGGEAGVPFVEKGTAEANVTIALTWSPSSSSSRPEEQEGGDPDV
jgi:hypothetical protein